MRRNPSLREGLFRPLGRQIYPWKGCHTMYTRRPKESYLDTVIYEIDMLRFCVHRIIENQHGEERDRYVYLEAFLLHYRNLIRFFSGEHHRGDDLSTADATTWAGREMTPAEVATIREPAKASDAAYYQPISKYLQHCTRARFDVDRTWDPELMFRQLGPIITAFERAFPC